MNTIEIFWQGYLATLPADHPYRSWPIPPTFAFGDNPALADELAHLVLAGIKTATCSSLQHTQIDGDHIFQPGELSIVLSGNGAPLCVVETVESTIRPYNEVDAQFAYEEGEDDRSLEAWRAGHWKFFSRTLPSVGLTPTEEMPLICERFRVIFAAPQ
ncbi:MAG: ASCH domain-containing protein [Caldilineaceae bacterium]